MNKEQHSTKATAAGENENWHIAVKIAWKASPAFPAENYIGTILQSRLFAEAVRARGGSFVRQVHSGPFNASTYVLECAALEPAMAAIKQALGSLLPMATIAYFCKPELIWRVTTGDKTAPFDIDFGAMKSELSKLAWRLRIELPPPPPSLKED